jgi:hypothetical protein
MLAGEVEAALLHDLDGRRVHLARLEAGAVRLVVVAAIGPQEGLGHLAARRVRDVLPRHPLPAQRAGWPALAWVLATAYLVAALGQMYVVMPLRVCVACAYATMPGARCMSGLNLVAARLRPAPPDEFEARRTQGAPSHNKLYMGSLIAPIPLLAPRLVLDFSLAGLAVLLCVAGLLALRILAIFQRRACPHCAANGRCPTQRRWASRRRESRGSAGSRAIPRQVAKKLLNLRETAGSHSRRGLVGGPRMPRFTLGWPRSDTLAALLGNLCSIH